MIGTIARVNEKGFGFLDAVGATPGAPTRSVFFHCKSLSLDLRDEFDDGTIVGRSVAFELTENLRGVTAIDVRPAD